MTRSTHKIPNLAKAKWLNEPRLQAVLAVLNTGGGETRVVGGAVRNALLRVPISDVDLATTLEPRDVVQLAKGAGFGVHPSGIEHGTVTVVNRAAAFEVTTLRRDVETNGRHARVIFTKSFKEDALRRDFTINALSCNAKGEVFDYTNGYADILKHNIRFVGKPATRITEDYLRILRFFRFHSVYATGGVDKDALAACTRLRKGLQKISVERIRQELIKLLVAPRAAETLKVMAKSGILRLILPYTEEWRVLKRLPSDAVLRLFVLAQKPDELKDLLRLSREEGARIATLVNAPAITPALREKERRAMLYVLGPEQWRSAVQLSFARSRAKVGDRAWAKLLRLAEQWQAPQFPLNGDDLLRKGHVAGPFIGEFLQRAEDYWIAGNFVANKGDLLAYIEGMNS